MISGPTLAALILALSAALTHRRVMPGQPLWWMCAAIVVGAFVVGRWM